MAGRSEGVAERGHVFGACREHSRSYVTEKRRKEAPLGPFRSRVGMPYTLLTPACNGPGCNTPG